MRASTWLLHLSCVAAVLAVAVPASAQRLELRPPSIGIEVEPPADLRRRPPPAPPARVVDRRWEAVRAQMAEYREACEEGDKRSCVRLGILIGENRERRAQWAREHPEMFSWDRDGR
jgi:hypothetical protein